MNIHDKQQNKVRENKRDLAYLKSDEACRSYGLKWRKRFEDIVAKRSVFSVGDARTV